MVRMFESCSSLQTVAHLNTSSVTNMNSMFQYCRKLTTTPAFDTSSVTNLSNIFMSCENLQTVLPFDTSKVNSMSNMFSGCENLQSVPLLNASSANYMSGIFDGCSSLTNLGGFIGLKVNLDLRYCGYYLTVDSIMNVINYAADMTSSPKTLVLKQYVFNKLSQEQIATATAKGWNIAAR